MADVTMEFDTAKGRREPINFVMPDDGRKITFNPPKKAMMALPIMAGADADDPAVAKATFDWLGKGLSQEDNDYFKARLEDDDDWFDVEHLAEMVNKLAEGSSGRPTT